MIHPFEAPLVIVFGAGSTIAEATHCGVAKAKLPPSDLDFLRRARSFGSKKDVESVENYVCKRYGTDLRGEGAPRMERVFAGAFSELLVAPEVHQTARALLRIYRNVIAKTTDDVDPRPDGPIRRLLKIAAEKPAGTRLVTFNQDLVIERALESLTKRQPGLWSIANGYGDIKFESFTVPVRKVPTRKVRAREVPTRKAAALFSRRGCPSSRLPLLKLHGSLNWYVPVHNKQPPPLGDAKRKPRCTARKSVPNVFRLRLKEGVTWTWPVIVPPVADKGVLLGGILRGLWQQAAAALSRARSVLLFGYSFPNADSEAEALFRSACRMGSLHSVVVVNPDYDAGARSYEIAGGKRLLHYRSCDEMLQDWQA